MTGARICSIGHSTRPIEEFLAILRAHGIATLADVRTLPGSRWNPQFTREPLAAALAEVSIRYIHLPGLGGLRRPRPDSVNTGWRNAGFRGYADHMTTEEFARDVEALIAEARRAPAVFMCAEAYWRRCHRSLLADALTVRGLAVEHIVRATQRVAHALTPFARVEGTRITYPHEADQTLGEQTELPLDR